jgi:hypothetical protein
MPKFIVTYTSMVIEADDGDEAIDRATEFDGGGHWEATEVVESDLGWVPKRKRNGGRDE